MPSDNPFNAVPGARGEIWSYGLRMCEGNLAYPVSGAACPLSGGSYVAPIHQYENTAPCRAIVGGFVSRDSSLQELLGRYLCSDNCTSEIAAHRRQLRVPVGAAAAA